MNRAAAGVAVAVLFSVAGCSGAPEVLAPDLGSKVDVDTASLRHLKAQAGIATCRSGGVRVTALPDVTLPCLGGGPDVDLRSIDGPAVINLWSYSCGPCREELPVFQRLHERGRGEVEVLGVDYEDTQPGGALTLAEATGVTYPLLADPGGETADAWRVDALPKTVFVDARGRVELYRGVVTGYRHLVRLVEEHTGVSVAAR